MTSRFREVKLSDVFEAFVEADQEDIAELRELWKKNLPGLPLPSNEQFQRWLSPTYGDCEPLLYAMNKAARRMRFHKWNDPLHHVSWISAVSLAHWKEKQHKVAA
jgi:hypothetical protein